MIDDGSGRGRLHWPLLHDSQIAYEDARRATRVAAVFLGAYQPQPRL